MSFWGRYSIANGRFERDDTWFVEPRLKNAFSIKQRNVKDFQTDEQSGIGRQSGHAITKAVAGGILFGGVGAVAGLAAGRGKDVGMLYGASITIQTKTGQTHYVDLFDMLHITKPIKYNSYDYQKLKKATGEIVDFLETGKRMRGTSII